MTQQDPIFLLIKSLDMLNLLPRTGNGRIEFVFQDGILIDTIDSNRTRVKCKIEDVLKSSLNKQTDRIRSKVSLF